MTTDVYPRENCIAPAMVFIVFLWPLLSRRFRLSSSGEWMFWLDALGLGAFASVGAYKGSLVDEPPLHWGACVSCAMFSATFGGFARPLRCRG